MSRVGHFREGLTREVWLGYARAMRPAPTENSLNKAVQFRVTEAEYEALENAAKAAKMTIAELLRELIATNLLAAKAPTR